MKRIIIIMLVALAVPASLFASRAGAFSIGFEAGYTLGLYDQKGGLYEGTTFSPGHFANAGMPVEYHFLDWLSLTTGVFYEGRAYGDTSVYNGEVIWDIVNTEHFFDFPLTLRFSYGNDAFRVYAGAGIYLGFRFMSTEHGVSQYVGSGTAGTIDNAKKLDPSVDNLFDSGFLAELGVGVSFGSRSEAFITARYRYSFTQLDTNYQENMVSRYIDSFSVSIGYNVLIDKEDLPQ